MVLDVLLGCHILRVVGGEVVPAAASVFKIAIGTRNWHHLFSRTGIIRGKPIYRQLSFRFYNRAMFAWRKWCFFLLIALAATCLPTTLFGVILVEREYHGKKIMCGYSGLVGVAKSCGIQYHSRVFTGTVRSAVEVGDTDKRLDIVPDEVFLGDSKEVTAITNQACLNTEIHPGDKWLFYVDQDKTTGQLIVSYAGPSKPLAIAEDDLSMLRELVLLHDRGMLTGHVELSKEAHDNKTTPLTNHEVIARNVKSRNRYTARTSQSGYFAFKLPAGSYRIAVAPQSAFREIESFSSMRGDVPVEQGVCWQHDFTVKQVKKVRP